MAIPAIFSLYIANVLLVYDIDIVTICFDDFVTGPVAITGLVVIIGFDNDYRGLFYGRFNYNRIIVNDGDDMAVYPAVCHTCGRIAPERERDGRFFIVAVLVLNGGKFHNLLFLSRLEGHCTRRELKAVAHLGQLHRYRS